MRLSGNERADPVAIWPTWRRGPSGGSWIARTAVFTLAIIIRDIAAPDRAVAGTAGASIHVEITSAAAANLAMR